MKKFIKQNIKGFIVGLIVTGVGIVTASTIIPSNSVTYNNSSQNVTNVKEALDVLLEKADNEAPTVSVSVSGKTATFTLKDDLGVIGYRVTTSAAEPTSWIDITSTTSIVKTWTASSAGTYYVHVKDKFGKTSNASFTIATSAFCAYNAGQTWTFNYTGGVQSFTAPCAGTYKLEVWGAQGGKAYATGGNGGYSYGNKTLSAQSSIYIVVGESGKTAVNNVSASVAGGYNGGGAGNSKNITSATDYYGGSGGGATHIATTNRGVLSGYASYKTDVLIVAGGGGGGGGYFGWPPPDYAGTFAGKAGGAGGGQTGTNGVGTYSGKGGTQTAAGAQGTAGLGAAGGFGKGGQGFGSAGGGGGWYGGGGSIYEDGGGGGSGYIGGVTGGSMTNGVQSGNGKAVITLVSISS